MSKVSRLILVLLTLLVGVVFDRVVAHDQTPSPHRALQRLPLMMGAWSGREDALPADVLSTLRVDNYVYRRYSGPAGRPITLYVAYYGRQRLDEGARIHSPSACLPSGGWIPVAVGSQQLVVGGSAPRRITANHYLVEKGLDRQVVLYWFQGRGRVVANEAQAALLLAFDTLRGRGTGEMLVRVNALVSTSPSETLAEELRFVQLLYPPLAALDAGS